MDTDPGEGELHGKVRIENGLYVAGMKAGETVVFWRGETPDTRFLPEKSVENGRNYRGVKRMSRF